MNKFKDLYDFIDLAKNNRKYPASTANNLKSALKIFEKELNLDELNSIGLIEDNVEEIFINTVSNNKTKNIGSLNTYKARLLKVIKDYQRYGIDPSKMQGWDNKQHKTNRHVVNKKDNSDKAQDKPHIRLSDVTDTPVENTHKMELVLKSGARATLFIPANISQVEIKTLKSILDSLCN